MKDDKLKELFQNYRPQNDPDNVFLARLHERLDTVELIRNTHAVERRRLRRAVAVSALVGFLAGIAFSCCLPTLTEFLENLIATDAAPALVSLLSGNTFVVELLAGTFLVAGASLATYELMGSIPVKRLKPQTAFKK